MPKSPDLDPVGQLGAGQAPRPPRRRSRRRRGRCCRRRRPGSFTSGSTSSGAKYRKRPCARRRSAPGSSSRVTARCWAPSTSSSTASTVAVRPARNMSCASARRGRVAGDPAALAPPGRRRSRCRSPGSTEASAPGSHQGFVVKTGASSRPDVRGRCPAAPRAERADRAVQPFEQLGRHASTRSMISAARGSVARASRFSSSVSVSVRRLRISSISVASNRSPGLSGAMPGWS